MPHPGDKPVSRFLAQFFGLGAFVLFGVLAWILVAIGTSVGPLAESKNASAQKDQRQKNLTQVHKAQSAAITKAGWVDEGKGIAQIPVSKAKTLVLEDLKGKKAEASSAAIPGAIAPAPAPAAEEAKPKAEEAKPKAEEAKPKAEEAKPKAEEAKPKAEEAKPKAEEAKPKAEEAKPKAEEAKPKAEEAKPKAEEAKPKAEEAKPKAEEAKPKAEEAKPKAEEAKPKAEENAGLDMSEPELALNHPPAIQPEIDSALLEEGRATFNAHCVNCHGLDGKADLMPGMGPSLVGSELLNGPTEQPAMAMLHGIHAEGRFTGVMVPWKDILDDRQIAGVINFMRSNFGNSASPPVVPEQIAWVRQKYADRDQQFSRAAIEGTDTYLPYPVPQGAE